MKFCINHIQTNKEILKREILQEIQGLYGLMGNEGNTEQIEKEIEKINHKKKKTIDLFLEGVFTKETLKEQNSWYDEKLVSLEQQLQEAKNEDKIRAKQINHMEQYVTALDEIMDVQLSNNALYGELLEKIVIYRDHKLDIWLNCLPIGFRLSIHTFGKGENFTVDIQNMSFIEKE